ncbi:hypothetical protein CH63R_13072 [Colletotrichum higginsianum IMI 349063]|uniref:Uncharacterized protein n=1 Tax=Colletotrichum higginsianum (strain IMI 349063) TaxID=759273 RepID=A0A1B7XW23_COLHI|nr:hypothetical protein CH63R_13072 [Colletotrichum higginsianum IMI 349063]OBR03945.1 hypothetical protein CH63R_13072 [Colletotrichum higginsianum IMI 349063]
MHETCQPAWCEALKWVISWQKAERRATDSVAKPLAKGRDGHWYPTWTPSPAGGDLHSHELELCYLNTQMANSTDNYQNVPAIGGSVPAEKAAKIPPLLRAPQGQGCKGQMAANTSRDGRESSSSNNNITSIIGIIGITSHNARDTNTPKTQRPPRRSIDGARQPAETAACAPPPPPPPLPFPSPLPDLHAGPPITETARPYRRVSLHPL